jgi:lipoxygenase
VQSQDADAKKLHRHVFLKSLEDAKETIEQRNNDPQRLSRSFDKGGLPYKYMLPSSGPGNTGQGVPYSVSI